MSWSKSALGAQVDSTPPGAVASVDDHTPPLCTPTNASPSVVHFCVPAALLTAGLEKFELTRLASAAVAGQGGLLAQSPHSNCRLAAQ